jgi:hypothetical protein
MRHTIHLTGIVVLLVSGCGAPPGEEVGNGSQAVTSGDIYNLGTLAHPGSCMDALGGGTADGTQIQEYTCNGTGAQSFELRSAGGGAFNIVNTQANKCVDVQANATANGTKIQLYDCNGTTAQTFIPQGAANGSVNFVNTNSNKCLDVQADNPASGTVVQLYECNGTNAQAWNPTLIGSSAGGSGSSSGGSGSSSGGTGSSSGSGGGGTPATRAVMYLDNWSGSFASWSTKVDFTKMTHLLLAFATVSGTNTWGNSLGDTSDVQTIAAAAHAKGVKVLVSIGGGGGDQTVISAYQSASNIAPLVANLDAMVAAMNLDGVDVDLESPGSMTSSSNYSAFVAKLISTFRPEGKLVTAASAEYIVQGQNPDATIVATLKSFDFINDMIYSNSVSDFTSEAAWWTGGAVGLPKDNLTLGICFGECGGAPSVATVDQVTTDSMAYGGVMCWDYTDADEATLWPAIQSAL